MIIKETQLIDDVRRKGTKGTWKVVKNEHGIPQIRAVGLGRFQDEWRTIATFRDGSILSHEDAEMIVAVVNACREEGDEG